VSPRLARRLGFPILVLYGMGTTIGAGIYALVGAVAGVAGYWTPIAFVLAGVLAGFTALSLAELSGRFPRAAGEAVYVMEGFDERRLATIVGLAVAVAGAISAATVSRAFAGYVSGYFAMPAWIWIVMIVAISGAVAARGIAETAWLAALLTVLEIGGLLLVIWVWRGALGELPQRADELIPPLDPAAWGAILSASVLCFYAFLGFEDMINVAEEVQEVRKTLPRAIIWTLVGTLLIYVLLTVTVVLAVPPAEFAGDEAPLALLYQRATGQTPWLLSGIGAIAMSNGALIQVVKSSRVLYGLAQEGSLPSVLARVHPTTHTPLHSTALVAGAVLALALAFPLEGLAKATSLITLAVFALVCAALLRVRHRAPRRARGFSVPIWIPWAGTMVSLALLVFEAARQLGLS
jgi:amino acid transporter